jgi:urease accessory protein
LESYTQGEIVGDIDALREYINVQLNTLAQCDMLIVKEAMTRPHDLDGLCELDVLVSALKTAYEIRQASFKVGRQFLRSALALQADDTLRALQTRIKAGECMGHHAVVHGVVYAALGFDTPTALSAFAYQFVSGQCSAAMKLISIGQSQAQALIFSMQGAIESAVEDAMQSTIDQLQNFTPALDIRAMQHEYLFRRLFHS